MYRNRNINLVVYDGRPNGSEELDDSGTRVSKSKSRPRKKTKQGKTN